MNREKMDHYKQLLLENKMQLEQTINRMKENKTAEQDKDSPTELSNYDNHPADTGTQLYDLEHNMALKIHEEHLLKDVNVALKRVEDNNYGKCAFCGRDIAVERLEAIPFTRLCLDCENSREVTPEVLSKQRPNEEKVIDAPFGRKYLNKQEDDEHEGMDLLNDLMKYGSADSPQDMGGYHDYKNYYNNEVDRQGIVDDMDQMSNDEYRRQLPD